MVWELAIRFAIGGLIVSVFAVVGDLFKPKTFSGLFGGAPSVALASLSLTALKKPPTYLAAEGSTMMLGAIALALYALLLALVLAAKRGWSPWPPALAGWAVWLGAALAMLGAAVR